MNLPASASVDWMSVDVCVHHLEVKFSLGARVDFVVFAVHTHVELVQRQSAAGEG